MLNHIRMGKLARWRPRGHHERVRESHMMNFVKYKCGDRDLPYRLSADRKRKASVAAMVDTMVITGEFPG